MIEELFWIMFLKNMPSESSALMSWHNKSFLIIMQEDESDERFQMFLLMNSVWSDVPLAVIGGPVLPGRRERERESMREEAGFASTDLQRSCCSSSHMCSSAGRRSSRPDRQRLLRLHLWPPPPLFAAISAADFVQNDQFSHARLYWIMKATCVLKEKKLL